MNRPGYIGLCFIAALFALMHSCTERAGKEYLKTGFLNPPDSARPGVFWYFTSGNISRQGITDDLEAMKNSGIGYALLIEEESGVPGAGAGFMGDEWTALFKHAVRETERLGINIIIASGPGGKGRGNQWVKPEESMRHLVHADTLLIGPAVFNALLPLPGSGASLSGDTAQASLLKEKRDAWYEDVRLLAFPEPPTKPYLRSLDEKAFYNLASGTSLTSTAPFFISDTTGYAELSRGAIRREKIIDLTSLMAPGGRLNWNVPPGKWVVVRFGKRNTGAAAGQIPEPFAGLMPDLFDTASLGSFFRQFTGSLLSEAKPSHAPYRGGWRMLHIGSHEIEPQTWSHRFMDEFIKRRGYDPVLYLPVISGFIVNSASESARFLWDLRQTASELIIENHAGYFKQMGRRSGLTMSAGPYGVNQASAFDFGAVADVPMGEFRAAGRGTDYSLSCFEAASAGNITGRKVVAAKFFKSGPREAWKTYPGNIKDLLDQALAAGISRIMFHAFAHKPHDSKLKPGLTADQSGLHWDRGQTWWNMSGDFHKYLSRCQFMLMQGTHAADILFVTPEGAPSVFVPPASASGESGTWPDMKGYSFGVCSPSYLVKNASVADNKIIFPSGATFRLLVLPEVRTMTPELLDKIDLLLKTGATVAGIMPYSSPSLTGFPGNDEYIRKLAGTIWGIQWSQGKSSVKYLNGTLYKLDEKAADAKAMKNKMEGTHDIYPHSDTIVSILKRTGVDPDFTSQGKGIRFHHRSLQNKEIYFISNSTGRMMYDTCHFRDGTAWGEIWDPLTGKTRELKNVTTSGKDASIPLVLEPYRSYFVVFHKKEPFPVIRAGSGNDFPVKRTLLEITGPWDIYFDPGAGGAGKIVSDTLFDWSLRDEPGIKYYSGSAVYSKKIFLPRELVKKKAGAVYISAKALNGMAKVRVNGQDAGVTWTPPNEIEITGLLKGGENRLEIEVANLWINRFVGDENEPWDGIEGGGFPGWYLNGTARPTGRISFTNNRLWKKEDELTPSGLEGPVEIFTYEPL